MSANDLAKSTKEKDQNDNDLCKKHTSRCDKDYYRSVCPSKLSKRELEDLYYSLLENNLELKRTINAQNEKNRMLSTKVQRMTAQTKTYMGKDCCASGKAVINEQKAALAGLTKANEALAERVRRLSTQLCTAKQFLKQSPNARHCYKCYANTTTSVKNLSTTSLQNKSSNVNLKSAAASAIHLDRDHPSTRTAETNTVDDDNENDEKGDTEKVCSENRCIAAMEQFKQRIGDLEEELAKTHTEYSARMTQLESQVAQLQAARRELGVRARDSLEVACRAQTQADLDKAELEAQLSAERKRVAELEMRLKAAELSQEVAQTVEEHLSTAVRLEEKQLLKTSVERCNYCSNLVKADVSPRPIQTMTPTKTLNQLTVPDDKVSKSDDSGYAEHRQESDLDDKNTSKTNQELMKMIEEMQAQLDAFKLITAAKGNADLEVSPCPKTFDQYYTKSDEGQEIKNNEKILPKPTTETSAKEAVEVSERRKSRICDKLNLTNEINIPSTDFEHPSKEKYERNDSDTSCECPQDKRKNLENSGSSSKNNGCKEHSEICANRNVNKQDSLNAYFPKATGEHEDAYSISLQAVGSMNRKPNPNSEDNVSVNSSTPTKNKRVSLFIFENGTYNRESAEMEPNDIQNDSTPPEPSKMKADDHNFQQIPGPLPVSCEVTGKRRVSLSEKNIEYYENGTIIDAQNKMNKVISKEGYLDKNIKNNEEEKKNEEEHGNALKKIGEKGADDNRKNKGLVIEVQYPEGYKKDNDSIRPIRTYEKRGETGTPESVRPNVMTDYNGAKDTFKTRDNETVKFRNGNNTEINGITRIKEFDICQHHATICLCPEKPSPALALLRSCSGGRTLATLPAGGRFRRCSCSERAARYSCGSILKDKPIGSSTPKAERAPPTSPHTYTIDSGKSRADSPANTDNEISVMTDLPSEKDDTFDRLSPGEHRPTQTSTETTCSLRHDYAFSEGEVPRSKLYKQERRTSKSLGEVRRTDYENEVFSYGEQKSAAEKMESTLLAISQELARCRSLLLSQRPTEQKDAATGLDHREPLPLRKTAAKSRIDGTVVPTCLFIMHVISVVFSDEVVLRAHNTHLMLTWQFSDYKPIVIPLDADRVVHFDFSTQHELQMTKEVVDYLKKEDLLIMISEMDNVKNNIASCTLPLRQMLLNINGRIDLSLPLRAGPFLTDEEAITSNTGEDVGVLDVWCMLLCEQRHLGVSDQSIAQACAENQNIQCKAEQPKEKKLSTEAKERKKEARQNSFQRQKFVMPSNHSSNTQNTTINIEGRQVGFEVPHDRCAKNHSPLQFYEKDNNMKRNSFPSFQQAAMSHPRISKSQFSKVPDDQVVEITILWLTLNENCESTLPKDRKLYVAYAFLGRDGAELETPVSLPRPKHPTDKCIYNFSKSFNLTEVDMRMLEHMVSCRSQNRRGHSSNDCIVFTVVSEPPEDPLGLDNCEDIGFAFLYLGDLLAYCSGNSFTEALPVRGACAPSRVCGVLAVRVDGLDVLRACRQRTP